MFSQLPFLIFILCIFGNVSTKFQNKLFELSSNGRWKSEQSSGKEYRLDSKTSKISLKVNSDYPPYNMLYNFDVGNFTSMPGDVFYFELERFGEKSALGWITEEDFGPGYRAKGMLYNNFNLVNIGYLISMGYTKNIGNYGKVGTLLERTQDSIDVYFYHNGRCLGCGFKLTDRKSLDKVWYPCISLSGNQTIRFSFPKIAPVGRQRENLRSDDPYKGDWDLIRIKELNSSLEVALVSEVGIKLDRDRADDMEISFNFKVLNIHHGSLILRGNPKTEDDFEEVTVKGFRSTMMGGPPDKMAFEREMSFFFASVTRLKSLDDNQENFPRVLLMKGPNVELYLQEKQEKFEPAHYYKH